MTCSRLLLSARKAAQHLNLDVLIYNAEQQAQGLGAGQKVCEQLEGIGTQAHRKWAAQHCLCDAVCLQVLRSSHSLQLIELLQPYRVVALLYKVWLVQYALLDGTPLVGRSWSCTCSRH